MNATVLPQDFFDHRRRDVARALKSKLTQLQADLCAEFGMVETRRVRDGIQLLIDGGPYEWPHPLQRPSLFFMPDIPPVAYFDPQMDSDLGALAGALELNADAIRKELAGLSSAATPYLTDDYNVTKFQGVGPSDWTAKVVFSEGAWVEQLPQLQRVMSPFEEQISGEILVSRLAPGRTIPPHVDDNNYKVTLQLGLSIPEGDCAIRVAATTRKWKQGSCVIFSDSFVHEVWNRTNEPRDVLLMDLWHPSVTSTEIAGLKRVRQVLRPVCLSSVFNYLSTTDQVTRRGRTSPNVSEEILNTSGRLIGSH
jgi:Aspartyl/Asparaginyl beta-hydroxylase